MQLLYRSFILFLVASFSTALAQAQTHLVAVDYIVEFVPNKKKVNVEILIPDSRYLSKLDFNLSNSHCSKFRSHSELKKTKHRLIWSLGAASSSLKYTCKINNKRASKKRKKAYDALITKDWALFRGDDIIPPALASFRKGAKTKSRLIFKLPKGWNGVNTGWERDLNASADARFKDAEIFIVDNPKRRFDRPTGWIIAGKLGTRRVKYTEPSISRIAVSAPAGSSFKQMDVLTFLQFTWPELTKACGHRPKKLLVVGADDPIWRGGLSAGNSFYMHADRPLVSENGTSTLLHELFHMCTGIRGKENADWISEGLAEFYSLEILHRAGGSNQDRYIRSVKSLTKWAKSAGPLESNSSTGATTAKAVLLFIALNDEIKSLSNNQYSLDDVVHLLVKKQKVNKDDLNQAFKRVTKTTSKTLSKL